MPKIGVPAIPLPGEPPVYGMTTLFPMLDTHAAAQPHHDELLLHNMQQEQQQEVQQVPAPMSQGTHNGVAFFEHDIVGSESTAGPWIPDPWIPGPSILGIEQGSLTSSGALSPSGMLSRPTKAWSENEEEEEEEEEEEFIQNLTREVLPNGSACESRPEPVQVCTNTHTHSGLQPAESFDISPADDGKEPPEGQVLLGEDEEEWSEVLSKKAWRTRAKVSLACGPSDALTPCRGRNL